MRVSTAEDIEYQVWFTRRFISLLWPFMLEGIDRRNLSDSAEKNLSSNSFLKKQLLAMQHKESMPKVNMSENFKSPNKNSSIQPLLPNKGKCTPLMDGGIVLGLELENGENFNLILEREDFHGFCYQLMKLTQTAKWELSLNIDKMIGSEGNSTTKH